MSTKEDGSGQWVPKDFLQTFGLFKRRPELLEADEYKVTAKASQAILDMVLGRVYGKKETGKVTDENVWELKALCDELGFGGFEAEVQAVLGDNDERLRREILCLKDRLRGHDVMLEQLREKPQWEVILALQRQVAELARTVDALSRDVATLKERKKAPVLGEFHYRFNPLDGIIAYLTRECGGNVWYNGVVNGPRAVVDFDSEVETIISIKEPWIQYDFKERRVTPTSYSIKVNDGWPQRSWVFEASKDNRWWEPLDIREDNVDLCYWNVTRNFSIRPVPQGSYRYIRLRLTSQNDPRDEERGHLELIRWLDVFGTLFDCDDQL